MSTEAPLASRKLSYYPSESRDWSCTRINWKEPWKADMDITGHLFGYSALAMLWIMMDKYGLLEDMKLDLLDAFTEEWARENDSNPGEVFDLISENPPASSPIRGLLAFISHNFPWLPFSAGLDWADMDAPTQTLIYALIERFKQKRELTRKGIAVFWEDWVHFRREIHTEEYALPEYSLLRSTIACSCGGPTLGPGQITERAAATSAEAPTEAPIED
jgi:hypothetical protein